MSNVASPQIGMALALGSLTVATNLRLSEPPGDSRERMSRAAEALTETLRQDSSEILVGDLMTSLSRVVADTSDLERRALLIELSVSNPFAPYRFAMRGAREACWIQALTLTAALSLNLEPDSVAGIYAAWRTISRDEGEASGHRPARMQPKALGGTGAGRSRTLAAAGLHLPAGPLIALAMPDAADLTGAGAVSAGLTQLGFGSVAAGGLTLTSGLWLLGLTDSAGNRAGVTSRAALRDVVSVPGSGHLLQLELGKLVLAAHLAKRSGWFSATPIGDTAVVEQAITVAAAEITTELDLARERNDRKAPRVRELKRMRTTVRFAASALARLADRAA